jgi:cobalt-zinc-cadmium efflux system protein
LDAHDHAAQSTEAVIRPLMLAAAITAVFTVVELVGGWLSGSLALLSDAGHMFTDTLALVLSLAAVRIALRPADKEKTYGFMRAEILAALVNGATLVIISVLIFYEAVGRILHPPRVDAPLMLLVATAGLAANAVGVYLLRDRSEGNLNVRGAMWHMLGDLLSSVGVIVGALLIMFLGLRAADPVLSIVIGAIILAGAWRLVAQSTAILLESVPGHIKLEDVREAILGVEGVVDVHDLHVWTLASGFYALSAHIVVRDRPLSDCSGLIARSEGVLKDRFAISHTTIQLECQTCEGGVCVFQGPK